MTRWALVLTLVAGTAVGQWATPTPKPTRRPTVVPAPTTPPAPVVTSTPTPRPTAAATPPAPGSGCSQSYVFIPSAPILRPAVGQPLRYADGTPFTIVIRLASGDILCQPVRVE